MNLIIALINDSLNHSLENKESEKYKNANQMILYCEQFLMNFKK